MAGESTAPLELPIGVTESKVLQQIARIESQLRKAQNGAQQNFVKSNAKVAQSFRPIAAEAQGMSRATTASLQNVSYQLQDIFVQIQGGQGAMRAFSQQMPQLLSGFGFAGAIAGLAASLTVSLIPALFGTAQEAASAKDAMKGLEGAFDDYSRYVKTAMTDTASLVEEYGRFAGRVREVSRLMAEVSVGAIRDQARSALDPIKGELAGIQTFAAEIAEIEREFAGTAAAASLEEANRAIEEMAANLGLTAEQAVTLANKIDAVFTATSLEGMADAAFEAVSAFEAMGVPLLSLPQPMRETLGYLSEMAERSAQAAVETESLNNWLENAKLAVMDLAAGAPGAGWLSGAISDALSLATSLWDAARAKAALGGARNNVQGGRGADPRTFVTDPYWRDRYLPSPDRMTPPKSGGGKRGGGGGGTNAAEKEHNELLREKEKLLRDLLTPAEKFAEELAKIEKLQAKGLISQEQAEAAKRRLQDLQPAAQAVRSALQSAFDGVFDDPMQALKDLAKEFAMMALKMQLMKSLPGIFGSGGMIPLTLNAAGGVYSGPGINAYSGKVVSSPTVFPFARGAGLMGEAGPEAILPLTRVNGRLGVRAEGGGSGAAITIIDQRSASSPPIETQRQRGPNGEELVTMVVKEQMARGAFNGPMRGRYGIGSQKVQR